LVDRRADFRNKKLIGVFKRHGQQVFEINPNDGSERSLFGTI
jgi:hypothetical protein